MVKYNNILRAIDEYIKCARDGPTGSSGVQGPAPKFEQIGKRPTTEEVQEIARVTAERWGLEISVNEKGKEEASKGRLSFWDDKHKTVIRFDKMLKTGNGYIDWTNKGQGNYNLDDVVRTYMEMPDIYKDYCEGIEFTTNTGASTCSTYRRNLGVNGVQISGMIYNKTPPTQYSLKQVLAHELGHASEHNFTPEERRVIEKAYTKNSSANTIFGNAWKLSSDERQVLNRVLDGTYRWKVSKSVAYREAMSENKVQYASEYSEKRTPWDSKTVEDFAEVMSAVAYRDSNDKSGFSMEYGDGTRVDYDTFVADHKGTYGLCCDYVDGKLNI